MTDNENKHENFADAVLMSYRSYVLQRENTDEYPYDDKYITKNGGQKERKLECGGEAFFHIGLSPFCLASLYAG